MADAGCCLVNYFPSKLKWTLSSSTIYIACSQYNWFSIVFPTSPHFRIKAYSKIFNDSKIKISLSWKKHFWLLLILPPHPPSPPNPTQPHPHPQPPLPTHPTTHGGGGWGWGAVEPLNKFNHRAISNWKFSVPLILALSFSTLKLPTLFPQRCPHFFFPRCPLFFPISRLKVFMKPCISQNNVWKTTES
jgi:hypothetical protein